MQCKTNIFIILYKAILEHTSVHLHMYIHFINIASAFCQYHHIFVYLSESNGCMASLCLCILYTYGYLSHTIRSLFYVINIFSPLCYLTYNWRYVAFAVFFQTVRVIHASGVARSLPTHITGTNISNTPDVLTRETGNSDAIFAQGTL